MHAQSCDGCDAQAELPLVRNQGFRIEGLVGLRVSRHIESTSYYELYRLHYQNWPRLLSGRLSSYTFDGLRNRSSGDRLPEWHSVDLLFVIFNVKQYQC